MVKEVFSRSVYCRNNFINYIYTQVKKKCSTETHLPTSCTWKMNTHLIAMRQGWVNIVQNTGLHPKWRSIGSSKILYLIFAMQCLFFSFSIVVVSPGSLYKASQLKSQLAGKGLKPETKISHEMKISETSTKKRLQLYRLLQNKQN